MCGIAGVIGALDPELEQAVRAMMDAELARGPDDSGFFRSSESPGAALGFRRLAIMDLTSEGHQPMHDPVSGNMIVFNGEIYNFASIREELKREGEEFRSSGDTEVLLRGYRRWGKGIVDKLRGMYAFAIYDPSKREVFLARDRLGIKPLYYAELRRGGGSVLCFASEVRALLATGLFERRVEPTALASYLWNGFVVGPSTMIRGITQLPAGASMTVAVDRPTPRPERYWSLRVAERLAPDEAVARLEEALVTATKQHLVSDVPLGVFLSGGVDSSATTALAVRSGGSRVHTFHVGFDEAAFDESAYASQVARSLGTEHIELKLTQARFREGLDGALASLDQPTFDAINTYFVSKLVREAGFTVALAGTGGDELFGGYRSFRELPRGRQVTRLGRGLSPALLSRVGRLAARLKTGAPGEVPPQTRWGKLPDLLATRGDLLGLYQVSYGLFTRDFLSELASVSAFELAPYGLPPSVGKQLRDDTAAGTSLGAVSAFELALFLGERLLRDTDAASMAVSLEVRVPLLDHEVVEAAFAVPDERRFSPVGKKDLLKRLAMPNLDPAIFDRPKAGFVLPIEVWAKDQLAGEVERLFGDRELVEGAGLRREPLQRLWRAFRAGAPGMYWSRVWAPFVLLDWCRRHRVALG
jgi:asparagine synthase (glutamine-hydrolysing)